MSSPGNAPVIVARGIQRSYGKVQALRGVDLAVQKGTILGLLGPNGAGKTTLVRVLATLLTPNAGEARVGGLDVVKDAAGVREIIGLAGQYAAVDEHLTGRENIVLSGRLHHMPKAKAEERAADLLARFDLTEAADRPSKTYSGGMRRRLDIAASLVAEPDIIFLDEPTTGLDPRSRLALWGIIEQLRREGKTILLTTQYLEEADRLADRIAVVDHGVIIAEGTASELKTKVGGDIVEVALADPARVGDARAALSDLHPQVDEARGKLSMPAPNGARTLAEVIRRLDGAKVEAADVGLRRPSLDDVFLALTGRAAAEEEVKA
ncbi:MAG TPA: ATP-binding cassette domain-containing protein [Candidatus Thermoplasmatota archaeon]|nr:ATP-binding cassette domain-containing protein [Candidatus Thermoplasmatota archaeon]